MAIRFVTTCSRAAASVAESATAHLRRAAHRSRAAVSARTAELATRRFLTENFWSDPRVLKAVRAIRAARTAGGIRGGYRPRLVRGRGPATAAAAAAVGGGIIVSDALSRRAVHTSAPSTGEIRGPQDPKNKAKSTRSSRFRNPAANEKKKKEERGVRERSQTEPRRVVVVLGVTGQLGMASALQAIKEGYFVYGTSRNPRGLQNTERFSVVQTPHDDVASRAFWQELFSRVLQTADEVTVVNTIGGAHAPEGMTLFDLNVVPAVAAAQGFERALSQRPIRARWVHASSIAAGLLEDGYSESKRAAEGELAQIIPSLTVLRVGYAFNQLKSDRFMVRRVDMEHAWGPEQMAGLPFQFLFAHDRHVIQPVYVEDLVSATTRAPFEEGCLIVHGVGEEVLTTGEFFRFFCELGGRPFRPVYISYETAMKLAEHIPHGHFAPYAVEYCRRMDQEPIILPAQPLVELLGRPTKRMSEVYAPEPGETLVLAEPPVREHMSLAMRKAMREPKVVSELAKSSMAILQETVGQVFRHVANSFRSIFNR